METLQYRVDAEGIALIAFDLPGRSVNVLTAALQEEFAQAVENAFADSAVRGIVVTSGKPGAFLAGADIKDLMSAFDRGIDARQGAALSAVLSARLRRLESGGKPVAAALNGLALGGGFELALACHYRVLADTPRAVVGLPEVTLGLLPGAGGTQRLPRLIGVEKAADLLLGGRHVAPAEALASGLVHALAPAEEVVAKARAWLLATPTAQQPWDAAGFQIAGGSGPLARYASRTYMAGTALLARETQRNYPAPLAILSCLYEGTQLAIDAALRIESKYFGRLLAGPVARNLMRTLFVSKGEAEKLIARPAGVAPSTPKKMGVLGAGLMGAGIAHVAARAGIEVVLLDTTQALADKGKQYSAEILGKDLARGRATRERVDAVLARIVPTVDYAALGECDLVIEAVFEDRAVKADVTLKAAAAMSAEAVFASNTSTLPISGLAQVFPQPENFIGLHFFSPVERMPLLEIIRGKRTSDATLARALDFAALLGKTPIVVNDSPAFYTTRVISAYIDDCLAMVEQGVAPALIENAARQCGMPVGPLVICDEVSLNLQLKVHEQAVADKLPEKFQRSLAIGLVKKMVLELKRGGRRSGGGFYEYPQGGRKILWPGLAIHFPPADVQPDVVEVKKRILYSQALESARCVEEGVILRAADADLGSILGIGFPSWTGGALSFIDTIGIAVFVAECDRLADRCGEHFRPSPWLRERARHGESFYATPARPAMAA